MSCPASLSDVGCRGEAAIATDIRAESLRPATDIRPRSIGHQRGRLRRGDGKVSEACAPRSAILQLDLKLSGKRAGLLSGKLSIKAVLKNRSCFFKADLRRRGNVSMSQPFRIKIILASFAY
jgi:hypothetical protein